MIDDDWFEKERLHRAAGEGDISLMQSLLAEGLPINAFIDFGWTPLHFAVKEEQFLAARWLIQHGADVNANDESVIGETPLSEAVRKDYPEMVELLLKNGADPDIEGWVRLTARIRANRRKDDEGKQISSLIERYRPLSNCKS